MKHLLLLILCTITLSVSALSSVEKSSVQHDVDNNQQTEYCAFESGWSNLYVENILVRTGSNIQLFARRTAPTLTVETLSAQAVAEKVRTLQNFTISRTHTLAYSIRYDSDYYLHTLQRMRV